MKTILSIPSGNRVKKLFKVIEKWQKVCDFEIAVTTWDFETVGLVLDSIEHNEATYLRKVDEMLSFAVNQNEAASAFKDWDIFICGADDLYPGNNIHLIEPVCKENPDKVIWVKDGLFDKQPTHPIITRGWYNKHGFIFDEAYKHNFTDTDLFMRLLTTGEVVKCFDIGFDHRHPIKGAKYDDIYAIGEKSYARDEIQFKIKHPFPEWDLIEKCPEVSV